MFSLEKILRPHILALSPYTSARDEYEGTEGIFLDANENPFGSITSQNFNRYPDPHQIALKKRVAEIKGVKLEQLFLGNGSDEPIDLLIRATCTPREDEIILVPPTYGMYEVSAAINDVPVVKVSLTPDFALDMPALQQAITTHPKAKLLFLCSPNNPTGNALDPEQMKTLIETFPGLVIIDEAYIDFADYPSFTSYLDKYPNMVVLQTFSKVWGLANLRLGMAFASPELIRILNKIKPPYNISGLTQQVVLEGLQNIQWKEESVQEILKQRTELVKLLEEVPIVEKIYPSEANFLLVKVHQAKETYDYLVEQKIIVRDRSKVKLCENAIRITVGTASENQHLVEAMKQLSVQTETQSTVS
ncbi:histidinol-phosphate transaminase [Xanthocytophaga agilis]|uniref:Histidinol-phosphate aminotransferase n=1 Tax=Xanthocytophaga agilis TaxID=3048010 RepID=A0AAE3UKB6_9BACT|nr:histidinol-phosphate transaminase [Xanthocytophaga agilis]MDJ1506928.1 histidinol-phosphate transaminase [Xanthocytophaga agilis]